MSILYRRLRIREVMPEPEPEPIREPTPEPEPEPVPEPEKKGKLGYILMGVMSLILLKLKI
jgi:hypothetical protein